MLSCFLILIYCRTGGGGRECYIRNKLARDTNQLVNHPDILPRRSIYRFRLTDFDTVHQFCEQIAVDILYLAVLYNKFHPVQNISGFRYGKRSTVHGRFKAWKDSGLLEEIFAKLSKECDMQDLSFDSTSCKVHQHAAGTKRGRKKSV